MALLFRLFLLISMLSVSGNKPYDWGQNQDFTQEKPLQNRYFYAQKFEASIRTAKAYPKQGEVVGGVVPHHLLASDMIAHFFKTVSQEKPILVCMLGPNHRNAGPYPIYVSGKGWETGAGYYPGDKALAEALLKASMVGEDDEIMQFEHSISSLLPYVKTYFPKGRVLPILFSSDMKRGDFEAFLTRLMAAIKTEKVIFIGSVDFSHELPWDMAEEKDRVSLKLLQNHDEESIRYKNKNYFDSPYTLISILRLCKGADNEHLLQVLDHRNAQQYVSIQADNTTSYFNLIYVKQP